MSYFEIGIYGAKTEHNIGTLWRSALQLGAAGIFTVGRRYPGQASDTCKTPRHIPLRHYLTLDELLANRAHGAVLVGVEMGGEPLATFSHPAQAIYLLGAEDHGLPSAVLARCDRVVSVESVTVPSYNVAVAGSLVMWHRAFGSGAARVPTVARMTRRAVERFA